MTSDLRQHLGREGERLAAEHLERLGYRVLARRHRTRFGEIDIVACHGNRVIVFCEVKTRRQGPGRPWDAMTPAKQAQVRRMAAAWLVSAPERPTAAELRFDAIGVVFDPRGRLVALDHLEGAF